METTLQELREGENLNNIDEKTATHLHGVQERWWIRHNDANKPLLCPCLKHITSSAEWPRQQHHCHLNNPECNHEQLLHSIH